MSSYCMHLLDINLRNFLTIKQLRYTRLFQSFSVVVGCRAGHGVLIDSDTDEKSSEGDVSSNVAVKVPADLRGCHALVSANQAALEKEKACRIRPFGWRYPFGAFGDQFVI